MNAGHDRPGDRSGLRLEVVIPPLAVARFTDAARKRGLRASAFAQMLLDAAWSARCAPTGDAALDAAVAAIEEPAPLARSVVTSTHQEPVHAHEMLRPVLPAYDEPAVRRMDLRAALEPAAERPAQAVEPGSARTRRRDDRLAVASAEGAGDRAGGRALTPEPVPPPPPPAPEPSPVSERVARVIRIYRWQGLRPLEIAQRLKITVAEVNAVLAAAAASRKRRG